MCSARFPDAKLAREASKIYDTSKPGRSGIGKAIAPAARPTQKRRKASYKEYLKTL